MIIFDEPKKGSLLVGSAGVIFPALPLMMMQIHEF